MIQLPDITEKLENTGCLNKFPINKTKNPMFLLFQRLTRHRGIDETESVMNLELMNSILIKCLKCKTPNQVINSH